MTDSLRILQLTDLHLLADPLARFRGVDTRANLVQALQQAAKQPPDLVILTGDLAQDESLQTYQWLASHLDATGWNWQWIPGNHDSPEQMACFAPPVFYQQQSAWQLLGLNTRNPGHAAGLLSTDELQRLEQALSLNRPLLIAMHHHPLAVGSRWMDAIALQNNEAFWQLCQGFQQPLVVICGHVHQESYFQHQGASVYSTPATALQFAPQCDDFQLDTLALPGMRWLELQSDGCWKTQVVRFSV